MKSKYIYLFVGLFLFGLSGCAVTDFDRSADFLEYKTFAWGKSDVEVSNPVYDSELINKRIRETVEREFAKRGIALSENNPDFIVRFHIFTQEKERASYMHPYGYRFYPYAFYPFAFGWGYPFWMGPPPANEVEYTEGTLIVEVIDNDSDELVWRGSVSGNVDDVAALKKQIDKGIRAIMKKYPVTPEGKLRFDPNADAISAISSGYLSSPSWRG